jgi:hypothetical protein
MAFENSEINGIIILTGIVFTIIGICLTIYLGNRFPDKRWLGILLSIVFAPWGQAYIEGSSKYIMALFLITVISKGGLGNYYLPLICSPIMMWYRFNKLSKTKAAEQKAE